MEKRTDNLSLVKSILAGPEDGREESDSNPFFDLLADDVVLKYSVPEGTPLSGEFRGKEAVVHFSAVVGPSLVEDVALEGPFTYVDGGDRVVMLGAESYTITKTGVRVCGTAFCNVFEFRDGRIVRLLFIKDMSAFVDACRI
jgi:ketosteroid isomerase-like protein